MAEKKRTLRKLEISLYKLRRKRINQKVMIYMVMLLISAVLWFVNKTGSTIITDVYFPIEFYGLAHDHYLLPGITTNQVLITVSGRGSSFLTHKGAYPTLRIDLSKLDIRTFPDTDSTLKFVTNDDIRSMIESQIPTEYKCLTIKPDTIMLDFGRSSTKKVPVIVDCDLSFEKQYRLAKDPVLQPDSVEVSGSTNIMDSVLCVKTESIVLQNLNDSVSVKAKLVVPHDIICPLNYTDVKIFVEKFTENSIEIPITPVNVPDSVTLRVFPQTVTLKYNISWNQYNNVSAEMFYAVVDYSDLFAPVRPKFLPIRILRYPENLGVTNIVLSTEGVEYLIHKNQSSEIK